MSEFLKVKFGDIVTTKVQTVKLKINIFFDILLTVHLNIFILILTNLKH